MIKGSRITIESILCKIAEGADERALLEAYPTLPGNIHTAVRYAVDTLAHEAGFMTGHAYAVDGGSST